MKITCHKHGYNEKPEKCYEKHVNKAILIAESERTKMRIYISASWKNRKQVRNLAELLEGNGYSVTKQYPRTKNPTLTKQYPRTKNSPRILRRSTTRQN